MGSLAMEIMGEKARYTKPTPARGMYTAAVGMAQRMRSPRKKPHISNTPMMKFAATDTFHPYSAACLAAECISASVAVASGANLSAAASSAGRHIPYRMMKMTVVLRPYCCAVTFVRFSLVASRVASHA